MLYFKSLISIIFLNFLRYSHSQITYFSKCTSQSSLADSKIVQTLNGRVKGECYNVPVSYSNTSKINYDVYSWLSIPYAEAPIGENRFVNPKPVQNWFQTINATSWPKSCIQLGTQAEESEDCLYLNIFVRGNSYLNRNNGLKPILLWIHGGAFVGGSSALDNSEPSTLVASEDVIIVKINYRVNVFGFFHHSELNSVGNAGFLDQQLAIKWVYDNAASFGGDNSKITIQGVSAGAWSVGFHLFYQPSWPYFRNAIMESGGPTGENNSYRLASSSKVTAKANTLFGKIGCTNGTANDKFKCAQNTNSLIVFSQSIPTNFFGLNLFDRLVLDNNVFTQYIDQLVLDGNFKKCNIITGFNSDEFGYFLPDRISPTDAKNMNYTTFIRVLPRPLTNGIALQYFNTTLLELGNLNQSGINYFDELISIQSDVSFICQAFELGEIYSRVGKNAYVYEYEYRIATSPYDPIYGVAVHTEEVPMVFGEPLSNKGPILLPVNQYNASSYAYSLDEKRFSEKMITYWTDFAKYDDPNYSKSNLDAEYWQKFGGENLNRLIAAEKMDIGKYLWIRNSNIGMKTGFSSHKCDYWKYTKDSTFSSSINLKSNSFIVVFSIVNIFLYI